MRALVLPLLLALLVPTASIAARPRVEDIHRPLQTFGFGSCNDQSLPQPLWPNILNHHLDLWLWMGDNVRRTIKFRSWAFGTRVLILLL